MSNGVSRRVFLGAAAAPLLGDVSEPIIDIHQHTNYSGRSDAELVKHQRETGVSRTVLLPAGSKYGLAADAGGNDTVVSLARQYPREYVFFANELPDIAETRAVLEKVPWQEQGSCSPFLCQFSSFNANLTRLNRCSVSSRAGETLLA